MEEKFPKNLEKLMGQLDRAVPPITPSSYTSPMDTNGSNADTDPNRETAAMVNAARQLAHGPELALPEAALDRIEARLRARHAALHGSAEYSPADNPVADAVAQPVQAVQPASLPDRVGPQRPIRTSAPAPGPSRARRIARSSWRTTKRTLRTVAAILIVMILLTSGLTAASASSVPNDPLYTVKLGVEEIRLVLVSTDGEPGLRVNFAERRLDEFEKLLARNVIYPKVLEEASAQMNRALTLLAAGHGNRQQLDTQIAELTYQQGQLIQNAAQIAQPDEYARLQVVSTWNSALYVRVVSEGTDQSTGAVLASGQDAPPILPETQPTGNTSAGNPTGADQGGQADDSALDSTGNGNAASEDDPGNSAHDGETNGNNGQAEENPGNSGNNSQGTTGNNGNTNPGETNSGQGNTNNNGQNDPPSNNGQGTTGNNGNTNPGETNSGQGNTNNSGQNNPPGNNSSNNNSNNQNNPGQSNPGQSGGSKK